MDYLEPLNLDLARLRLAVGDAPVGPFLTPADASAVFGERPEQLFFFRVIVSEMIAAGIRPDACVATNPSLDPEFGDIVVARLNGSLTLRRYEAPFVVREVTELEYQAPEDFADFLIIGPVVSVHIPLR